MGKTKIKTIDDSQPSAEIKNQKSKVKKEYSLVAKLNAELGVAAKEAPKSSAVKANGAVDLATEENVNDNESGDQQTLSKPIGRASDALRTDEAPTKVKKSQKPGKAKPRSKKYQEVVKDLDRSKTYPLEMAIDMVKKVSYAKFNGKTNGSLEAHINTAQTGVRGLVSLPFASGKKLRIVAFGKGAESSGADIFGSDSTIEDINQGKVDFDLVITTPDWMPKLAKVAKILGPKGIMPNPKNGTITSTEDGLQKAVESFQAGKTEFKTEAKAPVIHLALGKLNQPSEELSANVRILLSTIGKSKIKKVSLAPTMGPSVKLDLSSI